MPRKQRATILSRARAPAETNAPTYSHDPKAQPSKAERDRLDKAREKREKDMKGKRSKAPCKNHAEGHCKFGDSCQFSHAAPAVPIAANGCCIDLQGDNDIENDSDGEIIYVTPPAMDTVYCMAAQRHMHRIQEWGLDSGSGNHLVDGRRFIPRGFEVNGVTMNRPMKLATANRVINASTRTVMDVSILGNAIDPIVLENTIDVLSLGRLVIDNGYDFHWTKEHGATLVIDRGKEIRCPIKGYVPMLVDADIRDSFAHEAPALPPRSQSTSSSTSPSRRSRSRATSKFMDFPTWTPHQRTTSSRKPPQSGT